jgi:formylglycine-generating enzyme
VAAEVERPMHEHSLRAYFIGRTAVTAAQYAVFAGATGRLIADEPTWPSSPQHPVVNVSWFDAAEFCAWAGGRLPIEAEWEKAARGTDGRRFPWGDLPPEPDRCTWDGSPLAGAQTRWEPSRGRFVKIGAAPARSPARGPGAAGERLAGASPYGALDMAGGVWEWCDDWYDSVAYARHASGDVSARTAGKARVTRGGSWDSPAVKCRTTARGAMRPDTRNQALGFRIVVWPPVID